MTHYLVYDVFTDTPFGGNQLAILPDARALPEEHLQMIAAEFNFSEVVFLYPPENPAHTAKVRIFTPTMEVPFAGHPTIGTAVMLGEAGADPDMVLELGIGPMPARVENGMASFTTSTPLDILAHPEPDLVAPALGLSPDRIASPPVMASKGLPFTLTELTDRAALSAIATNIAAFRDGAARYPGGLDFAQAAWVRDGDVIHMRMFAPLDNIPEDPATGSAAATLGALLQRTRGGVVEAMIHQGDDMGRPSRIGLRATADHVTITGQAVRVMEGTLVL